VERHGKWTGLRRYALIFSTNIEENFVKEHDEKTEHDKSGKTRRIVKVLRRYL